MNIFFLHRSARRCAKMHVNKHVVKMILETTQLLCSAHYFFPNPHYTPCYKLTHKNHPCAIWTRESLENYKWLVRLGLALCKEYTFRYGREHKCESYLKELKRRCPSLPSKGFTEPVQAMPVEYKHKSSVQAYREYYIFDKTHMLTWKGKVGSRNPPKWVKSFFNI